jgi:L,D-transpeptidase catalytic domain
MKLVDLHCLFNDDTNRLSVWNSAHAEILAIECRNDATAGPGFGHNGRCPRGDYPLGAPVPADSAPFGWWFVPLVGEEKFGRGGIGIHAGGSGLQFPMAARQGWVPTHGCLRCQGADLEALVSLIMSAQAAGGRVWLTVAGK